MATQYDPRIIQEFADRLYREANGLVARLLILGAVGGCLLGGAIGLATDFAVFWSILGAVLFGAIGGIIGKERSFSLRLRAQLALCQVKIEENTRG